MFARKCRFPRKVHTKSLDYVHNLRFSLSISIYVYTSLYISPDIYSYIYIYIHIYAYMAVSRLFRYPRTVTRHRPFGKGPGLALARPWHAMPCHDVSRHGMTSRGMASQCPLSSNDWQMSCNGLRLFAQNCYNELYEKWQNI